MDLSFRVITPGEDNDFGRDRLPVPVPVLLDFDVDEGFELSLKGVDIPVAKSPMPIADDDRRPSPFCQQVVGDGVKPGPPGGMKKQVSGSTSTTLVENWKTRHRTARRASFM